MRRYCHIYVVWWWHLHLLGNVGGSQQSKSWIIKGFLECRLKKFYLDKSSVIKNTKPHDKEVVLEKLEMRLPTKVVITWVYRMIGKRKYATFRLLKNIGACEDCHEVTKIISKLYRYVVTDGLRFHNLILDLFFCIYFWWYLEKHSTRFLVIFVWLYKTNIINQPENTWHLVFKCEHSAE